MSNEHKQAPQDQVEEVEELVEAEASEGEAALGGRVDPGEFPY